MPESTLRSRHRPSPLPAASHTVEPDALQLALHTLSARPATPTPTAAAAVPNAAHQDATSHPPSRSGALRAIALSVTALGVATSVIIGMTTPAEALPHEHADRSLSAGFTAETRSVQAYAAPAQQSPTALQRDANFVVGTLVDLAGTVGISNFSDAVFSNDPGCSIQWPYAAGVPITYGYGMRDGRLHEGTDFIPGAGAHIQAIADGIVRTATDNGGAFGVTIVIDHTIDGRTISSRYAHMEYASRQVEVGDTVSVGQYIGRTGDTGRSFGAHLHFEIRQDGTTAIDPLPWLRANAQC